MATRSVDDRTVMIAETPQELEALLLYRELDTKGKARMRRLLVGILQGQFNLTPEQAQCMARNEVLAEIDALPPVSSRQLARLVNQSVTRSMENTHVS